MSMREYSVVISPEAERDLWEIRGYVAEVSSEANAEFVIERLKAKADTFNFAPERNEIVGTDTRGRSVRATTTGRYRLVYIVKRDEHEVVISRVFSVGRDYQPEVFKIARP